MSNYLIIIKADWNDGDYVYTHINTNSEETVELAKLARKHMDDEGRSHNFENFIEKFDAERDIDESDFEDDDNYFDDEGNFLYQDETVDELAERYKNLLINQYGLDIYNALSWLANKTPRSYDGDLHTVHEIQIYEYNKKH